jgi:hypothetical protein
LKEEKLKKKQKKKKKRERKKRKGRERGKNEKRRKRIKKSDKRKKMYPNELLENFLGKRSSLSIGVVDLLVSKERI